MTGTLKVTLIPQLCDAHLGFKGHRYHHHKPFGFSYYFAAVCIKDECLFYQPRLRSFIDCTIRNLAQGEHTSVWGAGSSKHASFHLSLDLIHPFLRVPFQLTRRARALQSEVDFDQQLQMQSCEFFFFFFFFDFSPLNMLCPWAQQAFSTVMTTKVRKERLQCCRNVHPQG